MAPLTDPACATRRANRATTRVAPTAGNVGGHRLRVSNYGGSRSHGTTVISPSETPCWQGVWQGVFQIARCGRLLQRLGAQIFFARGSEKTARPLSET